MASTTAASAGGRGSSNGGGGETEPLLGRAGTTTQRADDSFAFNLVRGTGILAQFGVVIVLSVIWSSVFNQKLIVFSAHPLLNSAGIAILTQGILVLQPTHTQEQKQRGTYLHATFNGLAFLSLLGGLIVVEWNKNHNHIPHFESTHAILGLTTYILILLQAFIGFTQFFVPSLYGGVDNAKKIYRYHRIFGYLILLFLLATAVAATKTFWASVILGMHTWPIVVGGLLMVIGIFPRIKAQKIKIW